MRRSRRKPIADAHSTKPGAALPVEATAGGGRCDDGARRRSGRQGRSSDPKQDMGGDVRPQLRGSGRPYLGIDVDGRRRRRARRGGIRAAGGLSMPVNEQAPIEITRLPLGAALCPRPGARPSRPLGARGGRAGLSGPPARSCSGRPNICWSNRSTRCPASTTARSQIFETGAIVQYIGEQTNRCCPRDPQGRYRAIQWTYAALNSVEPAILNMTAHRLILCRRGMGQAASAGSRGIRTPEAEARFRLARRSASGWKAASPSAICCW